MNALNFFKKKIETVTKEEIQMVNENMKRPFKFPSNRKKTKKTSYHNDSPMKPAKIKYTLTVTFVMLWVTGTCIELPVECQSANLLEMSWQDARKQKRALSDPEIPLLETGDTRCEQEWMYRDGPRSITNNSETL